MSEANTPRPAPLQWIRPPRQARTQAGFERLLDAADELLQEKPFDDVHVAEVARRAGTSVGALYRRFRDKEGLLHALHQRFFEEAVATADDALSPARWQGARIPEVLREVLDFLIGVLRRNHALDLAIYQRALSDGYLRERSSRLTRYVMQRLYELLMARRDEIGHPEPRVAVDFALRTVFAQLIQQYTVAFHEIEIVALDDGRFSQELIRTCLSYLEVREAQAPA